MFLLSDDQTFYSLGCYGNKDVKTPHMDSLAKDGMAFDCHYDTTAICMASRACVMTGLFEYKHGCNFEHGDMTQAIWEKTYPMLLRKAGCPDRHCRQVWIPGGRYPDFERSIAGG